MRKVLNIISNGLKREGVTSTQIEYMRNINRTDLQIDIAAVHNDLPEIIETFENIGCRVIKLPDRNKRTFQYACALYRLIKRENYDVVHVHGSSAILVIELFIARLAGVKSRIAHSRNTYCVSKRADKLLRPFFYRNYTMALACGKEAGEFLFPGRKFIVLHNGKDFQKFHFNQIVRNQVRKELNLEDSIALGFVGRLNTQKNPLFLIDILEELHQGEDQYKLVIIGDGARMEEVKDYATKKGVIHKIIFTGRIENVNEVIQALDIMLLPSLYEGLPNVVLEWQIAGLHCIISDKVTKECKVTENVEFLSIDNGVKKWVDAIKQVDLSKKREQLSQIACQQMKDAGFEITASVEALRNLYLE